MPMATALTSQGCMAGSRTRLRFFPLARGQAIIAIPPLHYPDCYCREALMTIGQFVRSCVLTVALTALGAVGVAAQNSADGSYPSRPIRVIVPYPPGGPTDIMGRLIAQVLSDGLGQQAYVDNRPGAGTTLGGKLAATADPDGYTLLVATPATFAIGPTIYPEGGLDPKALFPVAGFATVPYVMIAGPKAPPGSLSDVIAYAKAHPGGLSIGVPNGAPPHMMAAWFKNLTGADILIVPYKGAANDITDLMGGQIDLAIETTSVVLPHLADGSLRALATATAERLPEMPNVPTANEAGAAGFVASSWTGLAAPVGTPQAIVDKLNAAINKGLRSPAMQDKLKTLGAKGIPGTVADFSAFVATEVPKWTTMAKLSEAQSK
jgi:tripartite-type tricarboxylate transporter receptor subunit TctC